MTEFVPGKLYGYYGFRGKLHCWKENGTKFESETVTKQGFFLFIETKEMPLQEGNWMKIVFHIFLDGNGNRILIERWKNDYFVEAA